MTPERHARAKEIFLAACALPPEQRADHVRVAAAGDAALEAEVHRLLRFHSHETPMSRAPAESPPPQTADGRRFEPGRVVAHRYRIVAPLGRGGMGEVYRAEDLRLGQTVALKFLPPHVASDPRWLARFRQEVRIARTITHPNVCRVFDLDDADGEPMLSMEYIDGENLASLLKRIGRVPGDAALRIAQQLCRGLAAAHAKGVLHRDLKPANVMLDGRGDVRITDFGLASLSEDVRGADIRAGTPAYMAPEQLAGREVTVRSDLYSLGLILYELFTGRSAFSADTVAEMGRVKGASHPTPPSQFVSDVLPAVERAILRCLDPDPSSRPESALRVLAALPGGDPLEAALEAGDLPSPDVVASAGIGRTMRPAAAAGVLMLAVALVGAAVWLSPSTHPLAAPSLTKPAAVLADKARDIAAELAPAAPATDEAFGFAAPIRVMEVADFVRGLPVGHARLGVEDAPLFWYRQADVPLATADAANAVFGMARSSLTDPPHRAERDVRIVLDGSGRLVAFCRSPAPTIDPVPEAAAVPAIDIAFRRASLSPDALRSVAAHLPNAKAWNWADGEQGPAHRIEARSDDDGTLRFFAIVADPMMVGAADDTLASSPVRVRLFRGLAFLGALVVSTPLALLNLRRGQSDPRGALRLAAFVLALRGATWVFGAHHASDVSSLLAAGFAALAGGITLAAATWVYYVALEPFVRKLWPHTLIAWTRVLRGQVADPVVGLHVLVGVAAGAAWTTIAGLDALATNAVGGAADAMPRGADALVAAAGVRAALAEALLAMNEAILVSVLLLLLLALFRAVLRRAVPAVILASIAFVIAYFPLAGRSPISLVLIAGIVALAAWMLTRFGLVCVMTAVFVCAILMRFPLTFNPGASYADLSGFALVVCGLIAVAGFWAALRRVSAA